MWSLVEDLSEDDSRVTVAGRSYPVPCLVEGDDGARILVLPRGAEEIRTTLWRRAHADGAEMIVCVEDEGVYSVLTAEEFLEHREERAAEGVLLPVGWAGWEDVNPPTLRELLEELAAEPAPEQPCRGRKLVNIHTHTEGSTLDGCSRIPDLVARAVADGQPALSITDHGLVSLHPQLQRECEKAGIKPVFGMEAYFQDDRFRRSVPWEEGGSRTKEEAKADTHDALYGYWHLTLLAMDNAGLRNLWAMSTEAWQDGNYGDHPRLDWSTLDRLNEGVIATTGCLGGPICDAFEKGRPDLARERLGRLMEIFGDRLYVELGAIGIPEQIQANKQLVELAREVGLPLLVAVDSHYVDATDKENHRNWLRMQPSIGEDSYMVRDHNFEPFRTAAEVEAAIAYLGEDVVDEAMANTVRLAERCTARIEKKQQLPIFSKGAEDPEARDVELMVELIQSNWQRKIVDRGVDEELALARVERELNLLVPRGLPGFFMITSDIVRWAKSQGILVGPGRGSGVASIVAYLTDITEINPLIADLPFERFLTEERVEMPDFDIDFPSSKLHMVHQYVRDRFGDQYVVRIGTNQGVRVKSAVDCAARVLEQQGHVIDYAPIQRFKQVVKTYEAGLFGAEPKWDDVWRQYGDELAPLRAAAPAVFELAEWFYDLLRTYGTHPAGLAISTDEPLTYLPLRVDKDGVLVTQFDYRDLDALGFLKYDFLLLNTLDTLQDVLDMVRERYGREIKVYDWAEDDEYADPQVWDELCAGRTLGVFQIETRAGRRLTRQIQPRSISDLAAIMALGRPGPLESGLTETYLRRRFGDEPVSYSDSRLAEILAETYGVIVYQEQVMWTAVILAGYSLGEADTKIRKPLGKKIPEKMALAGQEFKPRAVEMGADPQMIEDLWAMLEKFAHYCLDGKTQIHLAAAGPHSDGAVTVQELYRRIHAPLLPPVPGRTRRGEEYTGPCVVCGATESWRWSRGACNACYVWRQKFNDPQRGLYGLSYFADRRIRPARILDVVQTGEQEVWKITLADGKSIAATAEHRHMTSSGYSKVAELVAGDRLVVDAGYEPPTLDEREPRGRLTRGDRVAVGSVNGAFGAENYGYIDGGHAFWSRWKADHPKICAQCGETDGLIELAHLDGDHANNVEGNLAWLCHSCHLRYDYARNDRTKRWQRGHRTETVEIVSIQSEGLQPTYDVVMEEPHNLVANGVVTHNSFGRAHSWSYATISFWAAWFKTHFPLEFLTARLTTISQTKSNKKQKMEEQLPGYVDEARRMGYQVLPPDVNESRLGFTPTELSVRFGLASIKGLGEASTAAIAAAQPFASFEDFMARLVEPKGSKVNRGQALTLVRAGAFDTLVPNRRALEFRLEADASGDSTRCVHKRLDVAAVNGLPCGFDWLNEPQVVDGPGKNVKSVGRGDRKQLVLLDPPKKCTVRCRHYEAPPPLDPAAVEPYTDDDRRSIEKELFGVYLSSTPFDRMPEEVLLAASTAAEIDAAGEGVFDVIGVVSKFEKRTSTRTGKTFGRVDLMTLDGTLDAVIWTEAMNKYGGDLRADALVTVQVKRKSYNGGWSNQIQVVETT